MGWKITLWYGWAARRSIFLKQGPGCSFRVFPEDCLVWGPAEPAKGSDPCSWSAHPWKAATKCSSPLLHPRRRAHTVGDCRTCGVIPWRWDVLAVTGSTPGFCPLFVVQRFGFCFSMHRHVKVICSIRQFALGGTAGFCPNFMAHSSSPLNYSNSRIKKSLLIGAFATVIAFDSNANLKIFSPVSISKCPRSCLLNFPFSPSRASYFRLLFTVFPAMIQLFTVKSAEKKILKYNL